MKIVCKRFGKSGGLPLTGKEDLASAKEREALAKKMAAAMTEETGYVLPILFSSRLDRWISSPWQFRDDKLLLVGGDSPPRLAPPFRQFTY